MQEKSFLTTKYDGLQVLRGICALFILTEHVRFLQCGLFGVDIFFCISGFMLMRSTEEGTEFYFRKRLIRILPLYYLMTLLVFVLLIAVPTAFESTQWNAGYLAKSLLFVPFQMDGVTQPLLRVGWTLNAEMFFYLLFYIGLKTGKWLGLSYEKRYVFPAYFQGILCIMAFLFPGESVLLDFWGNSVMLNFLFGMAAYKLCRYLYQLKEKQKLTGTVSGCSLVFGCLILIILMVTKGHVDGSGLQRVYLWEIEAFAVVVLFFLAGLSIRLPGALVRFGDISFSFYLIHYFVITVFDRMFFDFSYPHIGGFIGLALAIGICTVLSLISYQVVEKGICGMLRKRFCAKQVDR